MEIRRQREKLIERNLRTSTKSKKIRKRRTRTAKKLTKRKQLRNKLEHLAKFRQESEKRNQQLQDELRQINTLSEIRRLQEKEIITQILNKHEQIQNNVEYEMSRVKDNYVRVQEEIHKEDDLDRKFHRCHKFMVENCHSTKIKTLSIDGK